MKDFLDRVIARALATVPLIRPRLASLYESGQELELARSAFQLPESPTLPARKSKSREVTPNEPVRAPTTPDAIESRKEIEDILSDVVNLKPVRISTPAQLDMPSPIRSATAASGARPMGFHPPENVAEQKEHKNTLHPGDQGELPAVSAAMPAALPHSAHHAENVSAPLSDETAHPITSREAVSPRRASILPGPRELQPITRTHGSITKNGKASTVSPGRRASTSAEAAREQPLVASEAVHVTIGRVEIRAVLPTPSPPKRTSASPAISLQEYLKQTSQKS